MSPFDPIGACCSRPRFKAVGGIDDSVVAVTTKSPGEVAAAGRLLAEKQESPRLQVKQRKLPFFKLRRFIRNRIKSKPWQAQTTRITDSGFWPGESRR